MNTKQLISASLPMLCAAALAGQSLNILVGSGQGFVDDPVRIPIEVDDATGVVGASFVVTYDTTALDVEVTSDFFQPLIVQLEAAGAFVNGDPFLDLDIVEEGSSIQTELIPDTGMAIAATRILPADGSDNTLFVLWVSRKDGQSEGVFEISVQPLTLDNVDAGYPAEGVEVPLVVGFIDSAYTVLVDPSGGPGNINPGIAEFLNTLEDLDNDHMPDAWELQFFTDRDQLVEGGDYDLDGILDLVEYLLGLNPKEPDLAGSLSLEMDGDAYAFYFPLRNIHGLDFFVEWSTDAVEWIPDNVFLTPRPDLETGPDWTLMEAAFFIEDNPDGTVLARLVIDTE